MKLFVAIVLVAIASSVAWIIWELENAPIIDEQTAEEFAEDMEDIMGIQ